MNEMKKLRDLEIIDFVKMFCPYTRVEFIWYWREDGDLKEDDEYSFEGSRDGFIEKYTVDYDCIDGFTLADLGGIDMEYVGLAQVQRVLKMWVYRD